MRHQSTLTEIPFSVPDDLDIVSLIIGLRALLDERFIKVFVCAA